VKGAEPWWYTTTVAVARVFSGSLGTSVESALMPVAAVSVNASAEYNQWLIGVILTGLLLGLGTPFWVQAVTAAFNLQRWNRQPKGEKEKKEGAAA
jgi:hypothetical protein